MKQYHLQNKPDREITSSAEIQDILTRGKYAVVSMCHNNEPYIVSLSYGYDVKKNSLYFHCATKGLKLDFIKANSKVCATVIEDGGYVIDKCGHNYKTAVFWGNMKVVEDLDEKKYGMQVLLNHLEDNPSVIKQNMLATNNNHHKIEILRLDISQIHAKEAHK